MSYTGLFLIYKANGYPTNVYYDNVNESGVVPPPPINDYLLLETGDALLLESNSYLLLE